MMQLMPLSAHGSKTTRLCVSAAFWGHTSACSSHWHVATGAQHSSSSSSSSCSCSVRPPQSAQSSFEVAKALHVVDEQDDWLQRSRLLVGQEGLDKLAAVNVLLVGLGGVGSFAAEFLCRAGIGSMTIADGDSIDTTNRNRQLPALKSNVGLLKSEVMAARLRDINPHLQLTVKQEFLDPLRAAALVQEQQYHYVIDCIDSVAPKQALLLAGHAAGVHVVSSMGAGGRLDPSRVRLADISATYNDAFAAVVRKGLRKSGVTSGITVVFSDELARPASLALTEQKYKKSYFGTCSYIPALFGLYIASHVIRHVVEDGYQVQAPTPASSYSQNGSSSGRRGTKSPSKQRLSPSVLPPSSSGNNEEQQQRQSRLLAGGAAGEPSATVLDPSTPKQQAGVLSSFDRAQGVGMGLDGDCI